MSHKKTKKKSLFLSFRFIKMVEGVSPSANPSFLNSRTKAYY